MQPATGGSLLLAPGGTARRHCQAAPQHTQWNLTHTVASALIEHTALRGAHLVPRLQIFVGDLKQAGIMNPETIGLPSTRNDLAFLVTTVGVSSLLARAQGAPAPLLARRRCAPISEQPAPPLALPPRPRRP